MGDKYKPDEYMWWPPRSSIPPFPQNLVTRTDWAAKPPQRATPLQLPVKFIKINYNTSTERCMNLADCVKTVQTMQHRDVHQIGLPDIQYNFMVGGDAKVYEGRGWFTVPVDSSRFPTHTGKYLEIAFIGDHKGFTIQPSFGMLKAAWELIKYGIDNKHIVEKFTYL